MPLIGVGRNQGAARAQAHRFDAQAQKPAERTYVLKTARLFDGKNDSLVAAMPSNFLGMKPIDALKAGTSSDADLLGLADKISARKNIRQTEHVFFVMKEGATYKNQKPATSH